jgi:hypothetical protein
LSLLGAGLGRIECPLGLGQLVIGTRGVLPCAAIVLSLRGSGGVGQLLLRLIQGLSGV